VIVSTRADAAAPARRPRFNAGTGAKINDKSRAVQRDTAQGADSSHFLDARAPSHP
jgi:hypothetical protein